MEVKISVDRVDRETAIEILQKQRGFCLEWIYEYLNKGPDCMIEIYNRQAQAYDMAIAALKTLPEDTENV